MGLTLVIVLVATAVVLLLQGRYVIAIALGVLALPVLAAAVLRARRD